ncbi:M20 family metallopeptidase [Paenibacillus sp. Soil750]|uniref:M20 family metallopeptidase n=1 Tax=Paenibacillus sp. Soil750 TaxID=1736398 RepID=UPI0006FAB362|nr:M20 family metallopeptidase [Paenibacillus sp. Soil750]KRE64133.1 amidohydrolase [Paenibacillus sp. Soil750]
MFNRVRITEIIEQKREKFINVSDNIWDYAETQFKEFRSADLLCKTLEEEDFTVKRGVGGLETAFIGSYGSGKPIVAILGEYDALSGLSQERGQVSHQPIQQDGNGHGCGHNLLGTGSLAAAIAVRHYMEENQIKGTIRYYGCPAEEGGSGKTIMVREGLFDDADIAICWHPEIVNAVMSVTNLANYQVFFKFKGKASHASAAPHLGRSALDAVELMNIGCNYLREHIMPEARIHYAITNSGGFSPNVVQAEAEVLYLIRAPKTPQVEDLYQRVCKVARGAAMMTETEVEIIFDKACSSLIPNQTLETIMYNNFYELGVHTFDEAEKEFARQIRKSLTEAEKQSVLDLLALLPVQASKEFVQQLKELELSTDLLPYLNKTLNLSTSTDVGDVSWVVPTVQCVTTCFAMGTQLHSWQAVSQVGTSIGHKGMLQASKVMASTAIEVLLRQEVIDQAKAELRERLGGASYISPIPSEIKHVGSR